ncbi:hypothetical protein SAMN05444161_5666 [Rhizobiales bacterium GAS191]|nr:hypothetical protein SAMN05444161_5666 [Rhizobiales bacterium GAS191]
MKLPAVAIILLSATVPAIAFPITVWNARSNRAAHEIISSKPRTLAALTEASSPRLHVRVVLPDLRVAGAEEENVSVARATDLSSVSPRSAEEPGVDTPSGAPARPAGLSPVYPTPRQAVSVPGNPTRLMSNMTRGAANATHAMTKRQLHELGPRAADSGHRKSDRASAPKLRKMATGPQLYRYIAARIHGPQNRSP